MNTIVKQFVPLLFVVLMAGTTACVSTHKLPLFDGKETVATVNGEPITREEYQDEISSMHIRILSEERKPGEKKHGAPGKVDYTGLMKRLIDTRLILQEARHIGLYDLPEVRESVAGYSKKTLKTVLIKEHIKDVTTDEAMVTKRYKLAVGEWKFASAIFKEENDARNMEAAIKADKDFDELVEGAVSSGKAKGGKAAGYMKRAAIPSGIRDALMSMTTGSISPVIHAPEGYALLKLDDVRYEDSPGKRDAAQEEELQHQRTLALQEFIESLKTKYVKIDQELFKGLDYGTSRETFEERLKDERVIAEIEGAEPLKVSDLGKELQKKYFHGIDRAIKKKDLNENKEQVFEDMLDMRMLQKQANVENIEQSESYQKMMRKHENAVVFGVFIKKVVLPEVTVMESEVKAHYDGHIADYTMPGMMRLDSIVFTQRSDAEEGMRKLRGGDQLSWLKEHAERQVNKDAHGLLVLSGNVVAARQLPDDLKGALIGANAGDVRLAESHEGYFYVVSVEAVYPEQTEDYLSVREAIAKQLFDEQLKKGVKDWADELRARSDIRVYID